MVNLARPKVYKGWSIVKNSLRKEIVKKREELDEDFRKEYSQDLTDMFLNWR